jgi:transposase
MNSLTARDTATIPSCLSFLARQVLEVSTGRKKDKTAGVLERPSSCERVEAVSMDMRTTFREAVQ